MEGLRLPVKELMIICLQINRLYVIFEIMKGNGLKWNYSELKK